MTTEQLDIEALRQFEPLKKLSDQQLILLETKHEVREYKKKQVIISQGSSDNMEYFLVKGKLKLTAQDGRSMIMDSHSSATKNAIAHLQPRQYEVKALEKSKLLLIDWKILAQFMRDAPRAISSDDEIAEFNTPRDLILDNFREDLEHNTLTLPSLPDSALRVNELVDQEDCSAKEVAAVINKDPAMAVKLISAANSPLFRGMSSIKTCEDAITRLGLVTTQRLVRIYTLRELFKSNHPDVKEKMHALWRHCEEVAAIAFVMAKHVKGLSPDQAMLAGLIHDVGAIPILNYIESQSFLFQEPGLIDEVVDDLKAEVGKVLLEKWHWPDDLVVVAENADNQNYNNDTGSPDYVDLVVVSQLYAGTNPEDKADAPALDEVASLNRLAGQDLTPEKIAEILSDSREELDEARSVLSE